MQHQEFVWGYLDKHLEPTIGDLNDHLLSFNEDYSA